MESVIAPPLRVACSQAMLMLITSQPMRPGRSSQNDLMSRDPIAGLSSRPIQNYQDESEESVKSRFKYFNTYVIDMRVGIAPQGQQLLTSEGQSIEDGGLSKNNSNPMKGGSDARDEQESQPACWSLASFRNLCSRLLRSSA